MHTCTHAHTHTRTHAHTHTRTHTRTHALWALVQQAREGDCTSERPSWAANGGIDFHGRAEWDAWSEVSGLELQECKHKFVKAYYEFSPDCLFKDTR